MGSFYLYLTTKEWQSRIQYVTCRIKGLGIWLANSGSPASADRSQNIFKTIQASLLYVVGRVEGGKRKRKWDDGKGKERKRGLEVHAFPVFFMIVPRTIAIFRFLLLLALGYPAGASSEERGFGRWYRYFFRTESRNGGLSLTRSEQLSCTRVCIGKQIYMTLYGNHSLLCKLAKCASSLPLLFMC